MSSNPGIGVQYFVFVVNILCVFFAKSPAVCMLPRLTFCRAVFKYDGKKIYHAGSGADYSDFLNALGGKP